MTTNESKNNTFGPVIYQYTRAQAIEDGCLIDVTEIAKEAGFRFPVAMTSAVWERCVAVPDNAECQDETGRLWDILNVLRFTIKTSRGGSEIAFTVAIKNDQQPPLPVRLKSLCGPGDAGEPVLTIMLPNED